MSPADGYDARLLWTSVVVANPAQEKRILDYLHQVGIDEPYSVRVLHPIIQLGDKDWREYYRMTSLPAGG